MAKKKRQSKTKNQTSIKGKLVEMIVAGMHEDSKVQVQRNVRLPTLRNSQRKREIDVLISGLFTGYPVRIAIECKNHKTIIDVPYIDAYIGKLQDIGIPTQHGIYVSPVGFTEGALERAKEVGLTPLLLTGLTPDRLSAKIDEAIQSVIYLLPEITSLIIHCSVPSTDNSFQLWYVYDESGKIRAAIPDLLWKKWIEGRLPTKLGEYEIEIEIPEGWKLLVDSNFQTITSARAKVKITGVLITVQGKATQHALINPTDREVQRFKTDVSFETTRKVYPVTLFSDENDLSNFINNRPESIKLTIERILLPRIKFYLLYWPLSARAVTEYFTLVQKCLAEGRKASEEELAKIEGSDLKTIWDPMWEDNPLLQEMLNLKSNGK